MKVTLSKVYRTNKNKAGELLKTKDGRAYERISIKTQEHGDKWLSGFGGNWNDFWNEGDSVNINVETRGEYLNFSKVDPIEDLTARVLSLENQMKNLGKPGAATDSPDIQIDDSDIPY